MYERPSMRIRFLAAVALAMAVALPNAFCADNQPLRIATFDVDASPPVGSPLAYGITERVESPLCCRGVVLLGDQDPVVLCAVDWIGISGDGNRLFREALAQAAGTTPQHVAVHCIHQHDAPEFDHSAELLLAQYGLSGKMYDVPWARGVIERAAEAVRQALDGRSGSRILAWGAAQWKKSPRTGAFSDRMARSNTPAGLQPRTRSFSSNRKVSLTRMSARSASWMASVPWPSSPTMQLIRRAITLRAANPDFPGMARSQRQEALQALHVHFNGAGGNITAGKYNDGSPANRPVLAERLAAGMARAWESQAKFPVTAADLGWQAVPVVLPLAAHLKPEELAARLADGAAPVGERVAAAKALAFVGRCQQGVPIDITCLRLGPRACCTCRVSCSSSTNWQRSRCGPTCGWPWRPTATTARATSAPRSPTRRAVMKPSRPPRGSPRRWKQC